MSRPLRLLDLFCGAGGAAMGYYRAGFTEIVGVDIRPQKNYPFDFIQGDAMNPPVDLDYFDAIHASPPCQAYSEATPMHARASHPDLIGKTQEHLRQSGKPYVIENVEGARHLMENRIMLCGTQFGLKVLRHRYFECNFLLLVPGGCTHKGLLHGRDFISIHGGGIGSNSRKMLKRDGVSVPLSTWRRQSWSDAMGCNWMRTKKEIAQAIPPAYTEFIGKQIINQLEASL